MGEIVQNPFKVDPRCEFINHLYWKYADNPYEIFAEYAPPPASPWYLEIVEKYPTCDEFPMGKFDDAVRADEKLKEVYWKGAPDMYCVTVLMLHNILWILTGQLAPKDAAADLALLADHLGNRVDLKKAVFDHPETDDTFTSAMGLALRIGFMPRL